METTRVRKSKPKPIDQKPKVKKIEKNERKFMTICVKIREFSYFVETKTVRLKPKSTHFLSVS